MTLFQVVTGPKAFMNCLTEDDQSEFGPSVAFVIVTVPLVALMASPTVSEAEWTPKILIIRAALTVIGNGIFACGIHLSWRVLGGKATFFVL